MKAILIKSGTPVRHANAFISVLLSVVLAFGEALALPAGPSVQSGEVQFEQPDDHTLNVQASNQSVIRWESFNIASLETVNFFQPSFDSSVLNHIVGGGISEILGNLNATGTVLLVNPSGIHFGPSASVNVGSLIASTLQVSAADFLDGFLRFSRNSDKEPGEILNEGQILAREGGYVALLGGAVENQGQIEARLGTVALASGDQMTLAFDSRGLISVAIDEAVASQVRDKSGNRVTDAIRNEGSIKADGGAVVLTADAVTSVFDRLVNLEGMGIVEAHSVQERSGTIELLGPSGLIRNAGVVSANGTEENPDGGRISFGGERIIQAGNVSANAHDRGDAGEIQVISTDRTLLTQGSSISARGHQTDSRGGNVYVNSLGGYTEFRRGAVIDISGGALSGDGGFAEVSGQTLQFGGRLLGEAQEGSIGGRLLIDPLDLVFDTSTQSSPTDNVAPMPDIAFGDAPAGGTTTVEISDVIGFAEARFEASRDITVNNTFQMNNNKDLVLRAGRNINLNADIEVRGSNGDMTLTADADFSSSSGSASDGNGTIVQAVGTSILAANGSMVLQTGGDFTVRTVTGGGLGTVSVTSTHGNILDDGGAVTAITGGTLSLTANASGKGVGTTGALNTDISTLNLNVGSGGATTRDSGSFTLNAPTIASGGSLDIKADNNLTIADSAAVSVSGAGTLALSGDADSSGSGDLTMNSGSSLSSASGNISLSGAGDVDLRAVTSTSGSISATARGDVRVRNSITTGGSGTIAVTADSESNGSGTFVQDGGSNVATGGGDISITGSDNMTIRTVNAGAGNVSITGNSSGTDIKDDGDNTTKITANLLTLTANSAIGASGNDQMDASVNELNATANKGSVFLDNDKALTVTSATSTGSEKDVTITTSSGNINVGLVNAAGAVALTATGTGSILDNNGAANNIAATSNSSLNAAGTIGTAADALDVNVTTGSLTVSASGLSGAVSANIAGTVNPSNTLIISGNPPGQVLFNNRVIFPVASAVAAAASTALESSLIYNSVRGAADFFSFFTRLQDVLAFVGRGPLTLVEERE